MAGVSGGFLFAVRAGVVIGPVTFVLLVIGLNARRLLLATGVGLVAVTAAYVISPSPNNGGFYFYYALHFITAHWIALGAVLALGWATGLMAWEIRTGGKAPVTDGPRSPVESIQAAVRRLRPRRRAARS